MSVIIEELKRIHNIHLLLDEPSPYTNMFSFIEIWIDLLKVNYSHRNLYQYKEVGIYRSMVTNEVDCISSSVNTKFYKYYQEYENCFALPKRSIITYIYNELEILNI